MLNVFEICVSFNFKLIQIVISEKIGKKKMTYKGEVAEPNG
jgi:hypothetical protein